MPIAASDKSPDVLTKLSTSKRYWRRADTSKALWPWGLLSLFGLIILFLFGAIVTAPAIQAEVRSQVSHRLFDAGLSEYHVNASGQQVRVRVDESSEDEAVLHALARSAECETWVGLLNCPTSVDIRMTKATVSSAPASPAAGKIGEISDAGAVFATDIEIPGGQDSELRQRCNVSFEQALRETSVRFKTGSAAIDQGNDELLGRLADLARECPGHLTISGHTDSLGARDTNKSLSYARALAVHQALIDLGVDSVRLTAVGIGEAEPLADNRTAEGRAKNRRIAITIEEGN